MANLTREKITIALNEEFKNNERTIIFWFDEKQEFFDDIYDLELKNAKLYLLDKNSLFKAKILFEIEEPDTNFLVYAPFERLPNRSNHLADTILYSKVFTTDLSEIITSDLGMDISLKPIINKHIGFFRSKKREVAFRKYTVDEYSAEQVVVLMLAVITNIDSPSFYEVLKKIILSEIDNSQYISEFDKYNLSSEFWELCQKEFGYNDKQSSLLKLVISLFVTYLVNRISFGDNHNYKQYIMPKGGTVITFMDQLMNSKKDTDAFNALASKVYDEINVSKLIEVLEIDEIIALDLFEQIDEFIIDYIIKLVLDKKYNAKIKNQSLPEICDNRIKMHFGSKYKSKYLVLKYALLLLKHNYSYDYNDFHELLEDYTSSRYEVDLNYRKFYYYYDLMNDDHKYSEIKDRIERVYNKSQINDLNIVYNKFFSKSNSINMQSDFYSNYISDLKHKKVVIISDAMRYEIAKELCDDLNSMEKVEADIEYNLGTFPSITKVGMAALLPNEVLDFNNNYDVLVDGLPSSNLKQRETVLRNEHDASTTIQFDEIKKYNRSQLTNFFKNKSVIYIYQNQIDARGDDSKTEDEVFVAAQEAIDEIVNFIMKLTYASINNVIVTSDHGFIYKRSDNQESDKIDRFFDDAEIINRRFIISDKQYSVHGVISERVKDLTSISSEKYVSFPNTGNIIKVSGGGQNFYHGGSSLQEMIIPVVKIRTIRTSVETSDVKISVISVLNKITNLHITLDFLQLDPVTDVIKSCVYNVLFEDINGGAISNIEEIHADSVEKATGDRITSVSFRFKDKKYRSDQEYYLVIRKNTTNSILIKQKVNIEIIFGNGYGFDV